MSEWLARILARQPGYEYELVDRYTQRLLELAGRELPKALRRRVDPEDIVQSVYRSFFRRLSAGQFHFSDSGDIWRLLATMAYCKARDATKFHLRGRRDLRRESPLEARIDEPTVVPRCEDVDILFECLQQLLATLPLNHQTIVLRRLEGDSIEEIARHVQRSQRTVLRVLAHVQKLAVRQLAL